MVNSNFNTKGRDGNVVLHVQGQQQSADQVICLQKCIGTNVPKTEQISQLVVYHEI